MTMLLWMSLSSVYRLTKRQQVPMAESPVIQKSGIPKPFGKIGLLRKKATLTIGRDFCSSQRPTLLATYLTNPTM